MNKAPQPQQASPLQARVMLTHLIPTPVGVLQAQWSSRGLIACSFTNDIVQKIPLLSCFAAQDFPGGAELSNTLLSGQAELLAAFERYFAHGVLDWDLEQLDWTGITPFRQQVLRCCFGIAPGSTLSYGELAVRAGRPGAARAVGTTMATNRWPILIPCHRVVGSGGTPGGYSGAGGLNTKQALLQHELQSLTPCG